MFSNLKSQITGGLNFNIEQDFKSFAKQLMSPTPWNLDETSEMLQYESQKFFLDTREKGRDEIIKLFNGYIIYFSKSDRLYAYDIVSVIKDYWENQANLFQVIK